MDEAGGFEAITIQHDESVHLVDLKHSGGSKTIGYISLLIDSLFAYGKIYIYTYLW